MINDLAARLIKTFEEPKGPRLKSHRDPISTNPIWDIGYGHVITGHEEPCIFKPGNMMQDVTITPEQADVLFQTDIKVFEDGVRMRLDKEHASQLTEDQRGALVALAYNVGLGNFGKSAVRATINAGNIPDAVHGFKSFIRSGGEIRNGLIRRRAAEAALYQSDYEMVEYFMNNSDSKAINKAKTYLDLEM